MAEGFDDDGEDGSGDKLLAVLKKMDIGNILVIVMVWNQGLGLGDQKQIPGEFHRIISERVRELLTGIKSEVVEIQAQAANEAKA